MKIREREREVERKGWKRVGKGGSKFVALDNPCARIFFLVVRFGRREVGHSVEW